MAKEGMTIGYANVFGDPAFKNPAFLAVFVRMIPWVGFFLSLKYERALPFIDLIKNWNIVHITISLAFPIWLGAIYFLPKLSQIRNKTLRAVLYFIFVYVIITPALVILASLMTNDPIGFFKSYSLF